MLNVLKTYGIALVTFLFINMIWLNLAAKDLYQRSLKGLLLPSPNLVIAMILYVAFVAALTYFVIWPARRPKDFTSALLRAAIFGAICYATYNLNNLSTINGWPVSLSIIDIIWGAVLTTAVTGITLNLLHRFSIK